MKILERQTQKAGIIQEMARLRTPQLLDLKVADFLDEQGFPNPEVKEAFEEQGEMLTNLFGSPEQGLKKDLLYHGTGFYRYDKEKYVGELGGGEITPLFQPILEQGLKAHQDPWMPEGDMESVSLADSYFYAKWFASKNMTDEISPQWQLGDPNDFFRFFMADTVKQEMGPQKMAQTILRHSGQILRTKQERFSSYNNRIQKWVSSFRGNVSPQTELKDCVDGQSDVPGNFGIVLCLDKNKTNSEKLAMGGAHEVRVKEDVSPENIKAVGAPLSKIQEVQEMLVNLGRSDIKVFALECADLHFASFNIDDLVARVE